MLDTYLWGNAERISPEAPVPVVKVNKIEHNPGGAANVALNLATLGCKVVDTHCKASSVVLIVELRLSTCSCVNFVTYSFKIFLLY